MESSRLYLPLCEKWNLMKWMNLLERASVASHKDESRSLEHPHAFPIKYTTKGRSKWSSDPAVKNQRFFQICHTKWKKKSGNNQHSNSNLCYIKMQVYPWRQPLNHTTHPLLCPKIHSTFHWQHVCVSCSCFRCTVSP